MGSAAAGNWQGGCVLKPKDPVRYYGENAVVLEVDDTSGHALLRFDTNGMDGPREEWVDDPECAHVLEYGNLEQFALVSGPGEKIPYSPFGYLIAPDATVYSLLGRGLHGVIMAILYPEVAEKHGYRQPDSSPVTMHYTGFQIEAGGAIPLARVTFGFVTAVGVGKGYAPCTPDQIEAVRKALVGAGVKPGDKICCTLKDLKLSELISWLGEDHTPEHYDPETYRLVAPEPYELDPPPANPLESLGL